MMTSLMSNVAFARTFCLMACLTLSVVKYSQGITIDKVSEYLKFNITKRPLNLYIIANGKHAIINNRTLESIKIGSSTNTSSNKSMEIVDYRIAQPPFSIKRRGSVILLHNATGNSLSWHQGYPSIIQMLAASGHTTVSVELSKDKVTNDNLIQQIVSREKLHNITFISSDESTELILLDLLSIHPQPMGNTGNLKRIRELTDGIVFVSVPKFEEKWKNLFELITDSNTNSAVPILFVRFKQSKSNSTDSFSTNSAIKIINLEKKSNAKNNIQTEQDYSYILMHVLANYLDFIHPR